MRKYIIGLSILCYALSGIITLKTISIIINKPQADQELRESKLNAKRMSQDPSRVSSTRTTPQVPNQVSTNSLPPRVRESERTGTTQLAPQKTHDAMQHDAMQHDAMQHLATPQKTSVNSSPEVPGVVVVEESSAEEALILGEFRGLESDKIQENEELLNTVGALVPLVLSSPRQRILIEGHRDDDAAGDATAASRSYAWAKAVADVFVKNGVPAGQISIIDHGGSQPMAPNDTEEGRRQNRRVVIKLIPGN